MNSEIILEHYKFTVEISLLWINYIKFKKVSKIADSLKDKMLLSNMC